MPSLVNKLFAETGATARGIRREFDQGARRIARNLSRDLESAGRPEIHMPLPSSDVTGRFERISRTSVGDAPERAFRPPRNGPAFDPANSPISPIGPVSGNPAARVARRAGLMMNSRLGANLAIGAGAGAVAGAMTNQDHISGGFRGAMGGAVLGAMAGVGLPEAARFASTNNRFMSMAGSYSSHVASGARAMTSEAGRSAFFAAGGALGGLMFNGNSRDYRRGFNSQRGTHILA